MDTNNEQPAMAPIDQLAALLGTADPAQQVAVVQHLNAPTGAVTVLFDGRYGVVGVSSVPPMEAVDIIEMLAGAQSFLVGQMKQAKQKQQAG